MRAGDDVRRDELADALEPGEPASVFLQLQARTFVTMPESIDITQDVAKELNITLD